MIWLLTAKPKKEEDEDEMEDDEEEIEDDEEGTWHQNI